MPDKLKKWKSGAIYRALQDCTSLATRVELGAPSSLRAHEADTYYPRHLTLMGMHRVACMTTMARGVRARFTTSLPKRLLDPSLQARKPTTKTVLRPTTLQGTLSTFLMHIMSFMDSLNLVDDLCPTEAKMLVARSCALLRFLRLGDDTPRENFRLSLHANMALQLKRCATSSPGEGGSTYRNWTAMGRSFGEADSPRGWYEKNKNKIVLHDCTREMVERLVFGGI